VVTVAYAIQLFSASDITRRTPITIFGAAYTAAARAVTNAALENASARELEVDLSSFDAEDDDGGAIQIGEAGAMPYCVAMAIATILLSIWAGICTI
jgi:hypothetical protein